MTTIRYRDHTHRPALALAKQLGSWNAGCPIVARLSLEQRQNPKGSARHDAVEKLAALRVRGDGVD